jgi:hypothetical protein
LADLRLQGGLVLRVVFYWALWQLGFAVAVFSSCRLESFSANVPTSEPAPWQIIRHGMIVSSFLLPVAVVDMILFSNRFAGPILRLRQGLQGLAKGREGRPIRFRSGDLCQDLGHDFNLVLERVNSPSTDRKVAATEALNQQEVEVVCPLADSATWASEASAESPH